MNSHNYKCTPEAVQAQLRKILDSDKFDASKRNRRFLSYIVEETLAGRGDRIKAYCIAISVFGRDESFDPQMDAIVRIEARRLRRSLERYYLISGTHDPIQIEMPKGNYVPVFEALTEAPAPIEVPSAGNAEISVPPSSSRHEIAIFVAQFEEEGDQSAFPNLTRGFVRQLVAALTRFSNLYVFGPDTTYEYGNSVDIRKIRNDLAADYVMRGATAVTANRFGVEALLIETRSGRTIWSDYIERTLNADEILNTRREVANSIARTLAQTYGVIHNNLTVDAEGSTPASMHSLNAVLQYYEYNRHHDADLYENVRVGLEKAIQDDPDYAEALACLSQVYIDAHRFGFGSKVVSIDPAQRALYLAVRAVELAPYSSTCHHALALAYWIKRDIAASMRVYETGLSLNPNDTAIMVDMGLRRALLADWEQGVPLLQEAYARNPGLPGAYRIGLALYHYVHGRYTLALSEASRIDAPNILYGLIIEAMVLARLDRKDEALRIVDRILALAPRIGEYIACDLERRNLHPDLIRQILDGLEMAGLPCTDARTGTASPMFGTADLPIPLRR